MCVQQSQRKQRVAVPAGGAVTTADMPGYYRHVEAEGVVAEGMAVGAARDDVLGLVGEHGFRDGTRMGTLSRARGRYPSAAKRASAASHSKRVSCATSPTTSVLPVRNVSTSTVGRAGTGRGDGSSAEGAGTSRPDPPRWVPVRTSITRAARSVACSSSSIRTAPPSARATRRITTAQANIGAFRREADAASPRFEGFDPRATAYKARLDEFNARGASCEARCEGGRRMPQAP